MLTKELKDILLKNVKRIKIQVENDAHQIEILDIVDVKFDTTSRKQLYLIGTRYKQKRTDKFYAIKSYCLDFSDNREVLIQDQEKNRTYAILSDYIVDENTNELTFNVIDAHNRDQPFKIGSR